jgi:copper homeostasis protein
MLNIARISNNAMNPPNSTSNPCTIEVVASTLDSCIAAERGGAGRIELCAALATAGVTPSNGLLRHIKAHVVIPVFVMIRPREGDFCYTAQEVELMRREMEALRTAGADGFVFGALLANGEVDTRTTSLLVEDAAGLPCTFHRAIDCVKDPVAAARIVADTGCSRILTSGGATSGPEGMQTIARMVEATEGRLAIMPGGGIRVDTFQHVLHPKIHNYHLSGRVPHLSPFHHTLFDMNRMETSEDAIRQVVQEAAQFFAGVSN